MIQAHVSLLHDWPDIGAPCCMGSAVHGPGGCTCWIPIYDRPQRKALQEGPMAVRAAMCEDCAFRKDSPERRGDEHFAHSDPGDIEELVGGRDPFICHQGMRRIIAWRHPSGVRIPEKSAGAYRPPVAGHMAWKANGCPADLCAGWNAARAKLLAENEEAG